MAKCSQCGSAVSTPIKEWDVGPKLHVKLYECSSCGKKFREYGK
ncbi:chorismate-binding protein [Candidatus Bathyarchaeota archaeon]|nr:chorismate-binding protein [Candidatus Bathyarchaeota archaeon]